ncbi:MAG: hypothetical protein ACJAZ9_002035, partial [Neolewinella sp.]
MAVVERFYRLASFLPCRSPVLCRNRGVAVSR